MTNTPRVLVVDGLSETETVLRAVLEPQSVQVDRCRSAQAVAAGFAPQVLVLDLDDAGAADAPWPEVPRVLLGSSPLTAANQQSRFLEKPFQYPELVDIVRSLLDLPSGRRAA